MKRTALIVTPLVGLAALAGLSTTSSNATASAELNHPGKHFAADTVHSNVMFMIKHAGVSNFYGRFNNFSGEFNLDPKNPSESHFNAEIEIDSVDTGNANRDGHLKGPDFFNVRQFPKATFKSTSVSATSDAGFYELRGEFTLHGVTRPVTAEVEDLGTSSFSGKAVHAFEAVFTINRSEFGITQYLDSGTLGDEVTIVVAVEGVKQGG